MDDDLLPLSGLEALMYCTRQCALRHVDGLAADNRFTVEGKSLHERAHLPGTEIRDGIRVERSLHIRSYRLGLIGKADVVEFHREQTGDGAEIWRPFPVEYKRGRRKRWTHDEVQACAQALCLEEMLDIEVPRGAIYYAASKKRLEVEFDQELRATTEHAAKHFRKIMDERIVPPPQPGPRCRNCSLVNLCMPEIIAQRRDVSRYIDTFVKDNTK